ncbi:protein serine/threonine phosphatase [Fluviicola taffensis DSM 16823]|uniref:Protein serine/threonine phosphatase n=2 Tax=Fluviicola TaxID=332102 RepID=F2IC59_FLUTR|nr:protein serine/threonine phosphatase [Fluviicola taffensis DSM 16823]
MLAYTPMYVLYKQPAGIVLNSLYFSSSILTFILIHQKKKIPAFVLLVCASMLYFVASSIVYGAKVNLHFFLLIVCMLQVVLFNSQLIIRTFIALCIVSFFSVVIWSHFYDRLIYIPQQTESAEAIMGNVNLLLLFLIISLFILFFKGEMIAGQKRILEQKNLIEEKNKDITDSLLYAQRIQNAMLPSASSLESIFSDYFLFFKPKDIVSGDFYWAFENERYQFVAVGDCTGHGVPGCMMSVLGINLLIEIVENKQIQEPKVILEELRNGILLAFDKDRKSEEYKDGMDISIIRIERQTNTYTFAAANNCIYHLTPDQLEERIADRQSVGYSHESKAFSQQEFSYQPGDLLVLFTDGFADQFGGPKNKKFRYKPFQELLFTQQQNNNLSKVLHVTFENWKKELEQVDDVCVFGVRL